MTAGGGRSRVTPALSLRSWVWCGRMSLHNAAGKICDVVLTLWPRQQRV